MSIFDVNYDSELRKWGDIGILFAFVLLLRFQHWMFFWKNTKNLGRNIGAKPECGGGV